MTFLKVTLPSFPAGFPSEVLRLTRATPYSDLQANLLEYSIARS